MQFSNWYPEPLEVLVLKQQLANLQCKCLNCKKYDRDKFKKNVHNARVQANQRNGSADRFSQATSDQNMANPIKVDKACSCNKLTNTEDEICPSCRIIANFLSENSKKVFKDEESEAYAISCDKSTDASVEYLEKSTSTTLKCKSCDMLKAFPNEFDDIKNAKKRNNERVSFEDPEDNIEDSNKEMTEHCEQEVSIFGGGLAKTKSMNGYCVCLERFINSIRPPLS